MPGKWTIQVMLVALSISCAHLYAQSQSPTVSVKFVITSGTESPGWLVQSPEGLAQLREFLKGLPEAAAVEEPAFGGFLLTGDEAKCRFPARVRVFRGTIKATTADGLTHYFQDTKNFERFLLNEAVKRGIKL